MTKPKMTRDERIEKLALKLYEPGWGCWNEFKGIVQSALTEHGAELEKEIERVKGLALAGGGLADIVIKDYQAQIATLEARIAELEEQNAKLELELLDSRIALSKSAITIIDEIIDKKGQTDG